MEYPGEYLESIWEAFWEYLVEYLGSIQEVSREHSRSFLVEYLESVQGVSGSDLGLSGGVPGDRFQHVLNPCPFEGHVPPTHPALIRH